MRGDRLGGGVRVAGRVLHGDDAVVRPRARRWSSAANRTPVRPGHVVEHDGQVGGVGDGLDVPADALLRRARVVRADDEQAVRAGLGGLLGHPDGVRGVVGAGAGDDPRAVADGLDDGLRRAPPSRARASSDASPVVPLSTSPSWPWSTRCLASCTAPARSTAPSAVIGVTIAVSTDPNGRVGVEMRGMGPRYRPGARRRRAVAVSRRSGAQVASRTGTASPPADDDGASRRSRVGPGAPPRLPRVERGRPRVAADVERRRR